MIDSKNGTFTDPNIGKVITVMLYVCIEIFRRQIYQYDWQYNKKLDQKWASVNDSFRDQVLNPITRLLLKLIK